MMKNILLVGAGLLLFAGSFAGVALVSGRHPSEIPGLSWIARKPLEAPAQVPPHEMPAPRKAPDEGASAVQQVEPALASAGGLLGAFVMPAPYTASEIHELQQSLRKALVDAQSRLVEVERREKRAAEWEHSVEQRRGELAQLRTLLEQKEAELKGREIALRKEAQAKDARDEASWKEIAGFFEEGDSDELGARLAEFEPEKAAKILGHLEDSRARELVNALPKDKYKAYLEAYRARKGY
jgi:Skp family chaperone for outer membrane proteins